MLRSFYSMGCMAYVSRMSFAHFSSKTDSADWVACIRGSGILLQRLYLGWTKTLAKLPKSLQVMTDPWKEHLIWQVLFRYHMLSSQEN